MLGEFINELSEAATAKTKKADAEPKKIEKPAAEVNLSKLLNAEQSPAEKIQTPAEPNLLSQESNESAGQNPAAEKPPANRVKISTSTSTSRTNNCCGCGCVKSCTSSAITS